MRGPGGAFETNDVPPGMEESAASLAWWKEEGMQDQRVQITLSQRTLMRIQQILQNKPGDLHCLAISICWVFGSLLLINLLLGEIVSAQ